jgi:DNA polymerase-3 subunit epsilon
VRQIVLDTETTGLETSKGHRIIEIGCIELLERRRSGAMFHRFLNPEREIDSGALAVHGITVEFLRDKPRFADVADELWAFIAGAELIIHNAVFDLSFLEYEYSRLPSRGALREHVGVLDTLALARERYPGQKNSLDALCKRLGVDASHRELHGALLDASLLTDVYLAMTAGQGALDLAVDAGQSRRVARRQANAPRGSLRVIAADAEECAAHAQRLAALDKAAKRPCIWRGLDDGSTT